MENHNCISFFARIHRENEKQPVPPMLSWHSRYNERSLCSCINSDIYLWKRRLLVKNAVLCKKTYISYYKASG